MKVQCSRNVTDIIEFIQLIFSLTVGTPLNVCNARQPLISQEFFFIKFNKNIFPITLQCLTGIIINIVYKTTMSRKYEFFSVIFLLL